MSVMISKNKKDLIIDCNCGCDEGLRFRVDKDDYEMYAFASFLTTNREKTAGLWYSLSRKLKKIWHIIRGKDIYYSEICMTKDEFKEFKEYINSID